MMKFKACVISTAQLASVVVFVLKRLAHLSRLIPVPPGGFPLLKVDTPMSVTPHRIPLSAYTYGLSLASRPSLYAHLLSSLLRVLVSAIVMSVDVLAPFTMTGTFDILAATTSANRARAKVFYALFMKRFLPVFTATVVPILIHAERKALEPLAAIFTCHGLALLAPYRLALDRAVNNATVLKARRPALNSVIAIGVTAS